MTIELHHECEKRLIEVISEQLQNIIVKNRIFLERNSAIFLVLSDHVLPRNQSFKERLENYIGELPLYNFIYEILSTELYESQSYEKEPERRNLTEIEGYEDTVAVAKRLIEDFKSLPWNYTLTIKIENNFSEIFSKNITNYDVCDFIKLVTPNEEIITKYPLKSGIKSRDSSLSSRLGLLQIETYEELDKNSTYIQIISNGFIGRYGETSTIDYAVSNLKSFCGLSIALRLLKVNFKYRTARSKSKFFVHRKVESNWIIESKYELEASISDIFIDLEFDDLDGLLDTDSKQTNWISKNLKYISNVFSNKKISNKLILAGQWFFESYCGKNELLSFIQTTVALEILLGKKSISDIMGLGELLRNRCAYLIGDSHKQREEVLEDFREIYDIRSSIVHRGKSKLTSSERILFRKLQWMCCRVIQEEINLLSKDIEKETKVNSF